MRVLDKALPMLTLLAGCSFHDPRSAADLFEDGVVIIAHRGFSAIAPENTNAAFQAAAELGVPFELDVTLCADEVLCIIHDDTLDRTTDGSGPIDEATWSEVSALDAGSWFDPAFTGERIPRLDEVLATFADDVVVDIEIKSPRDDGPFDADKLGRTVARAVVDAGFEDRVFITSFNPYVLEAVRDEAPGILRGALTGTFKDADLAFYEKWALKGGWLNKKSVPDILGVEDARLTENYVKRMKDKGYTVLAWTVNDTARMIELVGWGVDGIITDVPDEAIVAMQEAGFMGEE